MWERRPVVPHLSYLIIGSWVQLFPPHLGQTKLQRIAFPALSLGTEWKTLQRPPGGCTDGEGQRHSQRAQRSCEPPGLVRSPWRTHSCAGETSPLPGPHRLLTLLHTLRAGAEGKSRLPVAILTLSFIAPFLGAKCSTALMSLAIIPTQMIIKQLVNALIEIHSRGVFHRDIKLENILIETGCEAPRIWVIDFGCATFLSDGKDTTVQGWFSDLGCTLLGQSNTFSLRAVVCLSGTLAYTSPEWFQNRCYHAEPTTVWQIGVVMYRILHKALPFQDKFDIICNKPPINDCLSLGIGKKTNQKPLYLCVIESVFVLTCRSSFSRMPQFFTQLSQQDPRGAAHPWGTEEALLAGLNQRQNTFLHNRMTQTMVNYNCHNVDITCMSMYVCMYVCLYAYRIATMYTKDASMYVQFNTITDKA